MGQKAGACDSAREPSSGESIAALLGWPGKGSAARAAPEPGGQGSLWKVQEDPQTLSVFQEFFRARRRAPATLQVVDLPLQAPPHIPQQLVAEEF